MKGFNSISQIDRNFKLTDLVKELQLKKEEREEVKNIERFLLAHALDTDNTGLHSTDNVELIYVFHVNLKSKETPSKFLKAVDKRTNAHTVFEIEHEGGYNYMMANKRIAGTIVVGDYIERESREEWEFIGDPRDLEDLYCILLAFVLNLLKRPEDTVDSIAKRSKRIAEIETEIAKLECKKKSESQLNKTIKINEQIRVLKQQAEEEQ